MSRSNLQNRYLFSATLGCVILLGAPFIRAATATAALAVSATIQATCSISAAPMAFGTYTGGVANSTSTLSLTCTNTTPYNVGLSAGTGSGATESTREMTGPGAALLSYALFSDSGRTLIWGNTIGTNTVSGTGNGSAQTLTVYGRVGAGQFLAPGDYTDTITATITY